MRIPRWTLVAPLAALALTGCGGDDEPDDSPAASLSELAALLPAETYNVHAADLDALRSELGLPEDADPADYPAKGEEPSEEELAFVASAGAQSLSHVIYGLTMYLDPAKDPLVRSIDHSQVSAAVSGSGGGETVAMVTSQPFDEIATALEGEDWSRDGDVLEAGERSDVFEYAADVGDGRILLAEQKQDVDAALAGTSEGPPDGELLDDLEGSVRTLLVLGKDFVCVELVAGGENLETGEGMVLVRGAVDLDASLERAAEVADVSLGEPAREGHLVEIQFTDAQPVAKGPALGSITGTMGYANYGRGTVEVVKAGDDIPADEPPDCSQRAA